MEKNDIYIYIVEVMQLEGFVPGDPARMKRGVHPGGGDLAGPGGDTDEGWSRWNL